MQATVQWHYLKITHIWPPQHALQKDLLSKSSQLQNFASASTDGIAQWLDCFKSGWWNILTFLIFTSTDTCFVLTGLISVAQKIENWKKWNGIYEDYNIFLQNYKLSTLIIILPMCQKRILHHPAIILSVYYQVFHFRKSLLESCHKLQDFHWQLLRKNEK